MHIDQQLARCECRSINLADRDCIRAGKFSDPSSACGSSVERAMTSAGQTDSDKSTGGDDPWVWSHTPLAGWQFAGGVSLSKRRRWRSSLRPEPRGAPEVHPSAR